MSLALCISTWAEFSGMVSTVRVQVRMPNFMQLRGCTYRGSYGIAEIQHRCTTVSWSRNERELLLVGIGGKVVRELDVLEDGTRTRWC